jgi:hypothetical protein
LSGQLRVRLLLIGRGGGKRVSERDIGGVVEARIGRWIRDIILLPDEVQTVQGVRAGCDDRIAGGRRGSVYGGGVLDRGEVVADTGDDIVRDSDFAV